MAFLIGGEEFLEKEFARFFVECIVTIGVLYWIMSY